MRSEDEWEREIVAELEGYAKSSEKYPKFCNEIFTRSTMASVERSLPNIKRELRLEKIREDVRAETVLRMELLEAAYELGRGNYIECTKELRSCITVLQRMVDEVKEMSESRRPKWAKGR